MKRFSILLALVPAVMLTSCYVTPAGGPYAGPPGPGPGYRDRDHDGDHRPHGRPDYNSRDRRDLSQDRDRGRPGHIHENPRSPYSPGGRVVLPSEARRVVYHGNTYYTHRNVWYRPSGSTYVIVRSPY